MNEFLSQIDAQLKQDASLEPVLRTVLKHFNSETGTIHKLDEASQLLHLAAQAGLPPHMLDIVKTIPVGKGIAGETAAKRIPVTICNLQTDKSGVAKPAAKQTGVGGALCVPITSGDTLLGTFGIGTMREHEYTAAEINSLLDVAKLVSKRL